MLPCTAAAEDAASIVLRRLNALRLDMGLPGIRLHRSLAEMAHRQTLYMHRLGGVTHVGPDGNDPPARGIQAGYDGRILSEALAETREGPVETLDAWLVHGATRTVLLDPEARNAGAACREDDMGLTRWDLVLGA
jgi:uncharacterized protein YkwD